MEFTFTSEVPSPRGRNPLDHSRAEEVIDACLNNANEWAKVPYVYLYPDAEGVEAKKLATRARNLAGRTQRGDLAPFNEYNTEAKARDTDVYIRVVMSARERRALEDL
ncbi:hypothetical protein [uncultured Corynebacterium sp.]|uniref:hypothetical protein n=1 Tax=uncultured Corynebacterium sp. TaxID=159447 RepID=UPI002591FB95|nr:hypothetical protein [uncultured Corynebacterium sp.]